MSIIKRKWIEPPDSKPFFDPFSIPSTDEIKEEEKKKELEELGNNHYPTMDDVFSSDDPPE